jgi:hypothetical protein
MQESEININKTENVALLFLVGILVLSVGGLIYNFSSVGKLKTTISGYDIQTATSQVVISSYLSLSKSTNMSSGGIDFGTITSLPITNRNATANYNSSSGSEYYITISPDTNVNVDFCIKASKLNTSGGSEINLLNYKWSNSSGVTSTLGSPSLASVASFTENYVNSTLNLAPGNSSYYRFWLNVSSGQAPGTYNNVVYFQGVQTGASCA